MVIIEGFSFLIYNHRMSNYLNKLNKKQQIFMEMVFGVFIYAVVLGFFNDYTDIFFTNSYSTTFLVAVVMQVLTYLTLILKKFVASKFKNKPGKFNKFALIFGVWLVLFLSKFVFLAAIDFIFGSYVEISGFIGLIAIILTMTVAKTILDLVFNKLED